MTNKKQLTQIEQREADRAAKQAAKDAEVQQRRRQAREAEEQRQAVMQAEAMSRHQEAMFYLKLSHARTVSPIKPELAGRIVDQAKDHLAQSVKFHKGGEDVQTLD